MRILWIPQISSKSANGEVLLNKDSNISVLRNLIGTEFVGENEITIAFEFSENNCIIDQELRDNFKLWFDESHKFTNAMLERMHFNVDYFVWINNSYTFDVIFTNEPTKVIPLRKIFTNIPIVCYNHWLAFKNMPEISLRQAEGMAAADCCFVNSNYVAEMVNNHYIGTHDLKKIHFVKAQPSFAGEIYPVDKINSSPSFIYNHRLSSDPYYADAYKSLCQICDILEKCFKGRPMPTIYFTNPSGKNFEFDRPYFKEVHLESQKEYKEFLRSDKICGHLNTFFNSAGMWSMSTVDCAAAGNPCILPRKYGYAEIFEGAYYGYVEDIEGAAAKIYELVMHPEACTKYENSYIKNHTNKVIGKLMNEEIKKWVDCYESTF
jgi:hypothetical protein